LGRSGSRAQSHPAARLIGGVRFQVKPRVSLHGSPTGVSPWSRSGARETLAADAADEPRPPTTRPGLSLSMTGAAPRGRTGWSRCGRSLPATLTYDVGLAALGSRRAGPTAGNEVAGPGAAGQQLRYMRRTARVGLHRVALQRRHRGAMPPPGWSLRDR
jgi:hypothetical protein